MSSPIAAIWPPNTFSYTIVLAGLLLDLYFYHASLSTAYYAFSSLSVHVTLWLNACVLIKPLGLHRELSEIRDHEAYDRIGALNQTLVEMYLKGGFLLPNLAGPIWICWYLNGSNAELDDLAHLYGFLIGVMHLPLLLSVGLKVMLPLVIVLPVYSIEKISAGVWYAAAYLPGGPTAAAQMLLRWLRDFTQSMPGRITRLLDREVLRTEKRYMRVAKCCFLTLYAMILFTTIVVPYGLFVPRLAIKCLADLLMDLGDFFFDVGMLVEKLAVKTILWEGRSAWMDVLLF